MAKQLVPPASLWGDLEEAKRNLLEAASDFIDGKPCTPVRQLADELLLRNRGHFARALRGLPVELHCRANARGGGFRHVLSAADAEFVRELYRRRRGGGVPVKSKGKN